VVLLLIVLIAIALQSLYISCYLNLARNLSQSAYLKGIKVLFC